MNEIIMVANELAVGIGNRNGNDNELAGFHSSRFQEDT